MTNRYFYLKDVDCTITVEYATRKEMLELIDNFVENVKTRDEMIEAGNPNACYYDMSQETFSILYKDGSFEYIDESFDGHHIKRQNIAAIVNENSATIMVYGHFTMNECGVAGPSFEDEIDDTNIKEVDSENYTECEEETVEEETVEESAVSKYTNEMLVEIYKNLKTSIKILGFASPSDSKMMTEIELEAIKRHINLVEESTKETVEESAEEELDERIMKYVPKNKKAAIKACWKDTDGYWIELKDGYNASKMDVCGCHTIHETTIKELCCQISGIELEHEAEHNERRAEIWENIKAAAANVTEEVSEESTIEESTEEASKTYYEVYFMPKKLAPQLIGIVKCRTKKEAVEFAKNNGWHDVKAFETFEDKIDDINKVVEIKENSVEEAPKSSNNSTSIKLISKLTKEEILKIIIEEFEKKYDDVIERDTDWRQGRYDAMLDLLRKVKIHAEEYYMKGGEKQ